ncbi:MAG TPA: SHOCT domain-containing protein [Mycobacterium sp.]|nr:SHOCT domain-containing protein [Mycobacterium sp.]
MNTRSSGYQQWLAAAGDKSGEFLQRVREPQRYGDAVAWRTVALLSALWCVLVIAPAAVATILFQVTTETPITGPVVGAWIVGYLLQFAVFMVISRKAPRGTTLGWFVASIMPWAADWTAPAAWWALAICAAIVVGYAVWLSYAVYREGRFRRDGVRARAVVLEVIRPWFNVVINNVYIRRTLRLRIERTDGTRPYEVRFKGTFMLGEIPEPGARLSVLIDPIRPQRIELVDSVAVVDEAPTSQTRYPQPAAPDITDQLQRLTSMHQRGDLTDREFAAAKKRLLGT